MFFSAGFCEISGERWLRFFCLDGFFFISGGVFIGGFCFFSVVSSIWKFL